MSNYKKIRFCVLVIGFMLGAPQKFLHAQNVNTNFAKDVPFVKSTVNLKGKSSGGILTLMRAPTWNFPYVAVTNHLGEPASSVVTHLVEQLSGCSACPQYYWGNGVFETTESNLTLFFRGWIFGGTETGFNIPPAPTAFNISYETNKVIFRWVNQAAYDSIGICIDGDQFMTLPGTANQYVLDEQKIWFNEHLRRRSTDVTFMVLASKGGTPSNGTGIRLRNYVSRESLMNIPFTCGVAPSFQKWTLNTLSNAIEFEQGNLPGMSPSTDGDSFYGKGFYQALRGNGSFNGGVSRRFIGLTPGHTYRASVRVNTFDSKDGNWSFSIHAAYHSASGEELTPAQMAGVAALPDKAKGPDAGLIACYNSSTNTVGKWVACPSEKPESRKLTGDVTLPSDVNSLAIWFRLQGTHTTNIVAGFDSVTLEDLGKL